MSDNKNLNQKVDAAEAAMKKYASKDTVISIGGYEFTPAKLMVAFTLVSSTLGGLYGAFEVYKDYMSMKEAITSYVAPDLGEFDKRIDLMRKEVDKLKESVMEAKDHTRDIKNDLKSDIDHIDKVTNATERRVKESEDKMRDMIDRASQRFDNKRDSLTNDTDRKIKDMEDRLNKKVQQALDNPLSK